MVCVSLLCVLITGTHHCICVHQCCVPERRPGLDEEEREGMERRLEEERDKWLERIEEQNKYFNYIYTIIVLFTLNNCDVTITLAVSYIQ